MRRSSYERDWGRDYDRPTAADRVLAVLLHMIPPIGPLRALQFKMPTAPVEQLFMASFDRCVAQLQNQVAEAQARNLKLADVNYDLGQPAGPGAYKLQDDAYAFWLNALAKNNFADARPEIRETLISYYRDPSAPIETKRHPRQWARVTAQVAELKQGSPSQLPAHSAETSGAALK
ncbi:MAG: hypothetical protein JO061_12635 [Acidobacteriaceae bacterium]|nr:hypothetical protein [Acidobacteriaceae bacterium]